MQTSLLVVCALLLIGLFLRATVGVFQRLYVPAAVLGGLVGLALATWDWKPDSPVIPATVIEQLRSWPGWLIAVVFAGLLLERSGKSFRDSMQGAARQGIVVWIIALGQVALGVLATWSMISRYYEVPEAFGQLIEVGFAGGHGTAAAMSAVYEKGPLEFPEGPDLAFFFATAGLLLGVVSGMVYVNMAVRRGWTRAGDVKILTLTGLEARDAPEPIGLGRIRAEVLDPLVFQVLIVAAALAAGIGLQKIFLILIRFLGLQSGLSAEVVGKVADYADNLPLFMFTLIGGLVVREVMHGLHLGDLIDPDSIRRVSGAAMEFLIVAAVTSINLAALEKFAVPIVLLLALGLLWSGFCLVVIAPRLLPRRYWFELGILNYGMSTATTAQGLMLLRIIDKDLASGAAEDYALAAPLSAPFVGGGVITLMLMPWLLGHFHQGLVAATLLLVIAGLYVVGAWMARSER